MSELARKAHWPPFYIYLQSVVIALVVWYLMRGYYVDDAYISLRYARNLLDGYGMTWNPGERVEGYTNFLFIVLEAALGRLGIDLVLASRILSFAGFFGVVAIVGAYVRAFSRAPRPYAESVNVALCVGLVLSSIPLLAWCMGGLEGNLYAFFLTAGVSLTLGLLQGRSGRARAVLLGLSFALAALTRPDGVIFCIFTLAFLGGLWLWPSSRSRIRLADVVIAGATFAMVFLPYTAWRIWYFGDFFPNTYYAKVYGIDRGILLIRGIFYLFQYAFMPPLLIFFALGATVLARRLTLSLLYLLAFALLYMVYIASVGGDYMALGTFRFLAPLVPILALVIYHAGLALIERREKWFRDLCGCLVFFSIFQLGTIESHPGQTVGSISGMAVKDYIAAHWAPGSLIALNPVGALPYYDSNYRYLDMLGLLDKHISHRKITVLPPSLEAFPVAHIKGDGNYVLSARPDYIIFGHGWGSSAPLFLSDVEIAENPEFKKLYHKVEIYIDPPPRLLPALQEEYHTRMEQAKAKGIAPSANTIVLDAQNRLRFIYYRRVDIIEK
ncbi:MAG: hypothetical protein KGJ06_00625 [Pseudomonadota bacterium]|nr:hypothetical protein [Pseudomonadota bacterium]